MSCLTKDFKSWILPWTPTNMGPHMTECTRNLLMAACKNEEILKFSPVILLLPPTNKECVGRWGGGTGHLGIFSRKLHENEEIGPRERGGGTYPLWLPNPRMYFVLHV